MGTVFYYLLKEPDLMHRLQSEIRTCFSSYGDIDALSTNNLALLGAVIQEALRMYPPLPLGLPRIVPQGGDTVDGHYLPAGVSYETLNGQHACLTLIDTSVNKPAGSNHECKELPRSLGLSPREVDWKKQWRFKGGVATLFSRYAHLHWSKVCQNFCKWYRIGSMLMACEALPGLR